MVGPNWHEAVDPTPPTRSTRHGDRGGGVRRPHRRRSHRSRPHRPARLSRALRPVCRAHPPLRCSPLRRPRNSTGRHGRDLLSGLAFTAYLRRPAGGERGSMVVRHCPARPRPSRAGAAAAARRHGCPWGGPPVRDARSEPGSAVHGVRSRRRPCRSARIAPTRPTSSRRTARHSRRPTPTSPAPSTPPRPPPASAFTAALPPFDPPSPKPRRRHD